MHWLFLHPRKFCIRHSFASDGILSDLCNESESVSNSLLTSSSACSACNVVEGGFLTIDAMSVAASFRKSVKVTAGKEIARGKNSTVSLSISDLFRGMYHCAHR